MVDKRERITFYFGKNDVSVAIGKDAPEHPIVAEWAERHGAEASLVAPMNVTMDDYYYDRGDFVAQGDLDLYEEDKDRRRMAARRDYREGWRLVNASKAAQDEANTIHMFLYGTPRRKEKAARKLLENGYEVSR